MARATSSVDSKTYVPDASQELLLADFMRVLHESGETASLGRPALVAADGHQVVLPDALYDVLLQVADALVGGMGVSIHPLNAMLTTQEAADYLGISRPTLVRMLDRGDLPMVRPGRHRFVLLKDLVDYQDGSRTNRRRILEEMAQRANTDGVYDRTDGPAPATR